MFINICSAKSDWIHNTKNATIQDFVEQKKHLEDVLEPIMLKLNTMWELIYLIYPICREADNWAFYFIQYQTKPN